MYRYSVFLNNDKKNSDTLPILCPKCLSESMETSKNIYSEGYLLFNFNYLYF